MATIQQLEAWPVSLPLAEPYTLGERTLTEIPHVFVRLETNTGLTGLGCAVAKDVEEQQAILRLFSEKVEPNLHQQDPFQIARHMAFLQSICPGACALVAMVDMALYDLLAKKARLPLYKVLGGYRKSISISITIFDAPVQETVYRAVEFHKQGFIHFKIKGGQELERDIERIQRIREELGKDIKLRFEAGHGYTVKEAVRFFRETRDCNLEIVEALTDETQLDILGMLKNNTRLPALANKDLRSFKEIRKLAESESIDLVHIKLMNVGGITRALHLNSAAKVAGIQSIIGCTFESALGISAGLHMALALPNVLFADLDGHLHLLDDPAKGCLILKDGVLYPKEKPGLGLISL